MTRRLVATIAAAALLGACSMQAHHQPTLADVSDQRSETRPYAPIADESKPEPITSSSESTEAESVADTAAERPAPRPAKPAPSVPTDYMEKRRAEYDANPPQRLKSLNRVRSQSLTIIRGTASPSGGGVAQGSVTAAAPRVSRAPPPSETNATGGEGYINYGVNPFTVTSEDRLSTFAVDVDTASYTIARRKLLEGRLPPGDSVRVEEFLNYFRYSYPSPETTPFAVHMDAAPSPFTPGRHLLRVGVQGRKLSLAERKKANLVFLVDVSGSMHSPDKLPLAKRSLRYLVDNLRDGDTVSLVTYAGATREVLPPTGLEHKARIHAAIEALTAGGSTAMASGIELAYRNAMKGLGPDTNARVIVLSDGDANVGNTSHQDILKTIQRYVSEGVTLTTVGFGMGNYKDTMMEQLANKGNGNNFYVDSPMQARRVFQEQLGGTLEVIAQDVKVQVEFNPEAVRRYRLVGYENRDIRDQDFRNDRVDAGEIGSGHSVTALYELELNGEPGAQSLATVRVRAKKPRGEKASETAFVFDGRRLARTFEEAPADLRFATAVMGAAEIFRQSPHARDWSLDDVLKIARGATQPGNHERQEFCDLVSKARSIAPMAAR